MAKSRNNKGKGQQNGGKESVKDEIKVNGHHQEVLEEESNNKKLELPTPLPQSLLKSVAKKTSKKSQSEQPIEEELILTTEELLAKKKEIKRKKSVKEFGDIEVKVVKGNNPWDLPAIKLDKSAVDFYQTALYGSRSLSRQRKQTGLSLDAGIIGPAPKFVRD